MRPVKPCSARWLKYFRRPSRRRVQAVQWAMVVMEEARRPAARSWRRFASHRLRWIWGPRLEWPGARAVRKSMGYFSRMGSES